MRALAPDDGANRLVARIEAGEAPRSVFATFALEQHQVITADRLSFRHLARRADADPPVADFFELLAQGETLALRQLAGLTDACGLTARDVDDYQPRPGCQAYPSYAARLALGAEPADVVIALTANFAAWTRWCAVVETAMRSLSAWLSSHVPVCPTVGLARRCALRRPARSWPSRRGCCSPLRLAAGVVFSGAVPALQTSSSGPAPPVSGSFSADWGGPYPLPAGTWTSPAPPPSFTSPQREGTGRRGRLCGRKASAVHTTGPGGPSPHPPQPSPPQAQRRASPAAGETGTWEAPQSAQRRTTPAAGKPTTWGHPQGGRSPHPSRSHAPAAARCPRPGRCRAGHA
ncbi:hypothetical protein [Streptomyces endophytica]|uniref:Thiaminase-2/PQQC domain-containing protein n=1 Tax=Streptomyces endophytica TaxID=2991496 RepID=A0ABY6PKD2_9ACTN|nr:hypothetical protein [Streptomyces endophytica]UZJ34231.1 hypothetical protein OJ254_29070 [Streptomyces endophytica]